MKTSDAAKLRERDRAIRAKCLECSGGMRNEVRDCRLKNCPLWPYRGAGSETRRAEDTPSVIPSGHLHLKGKTEGHRELVGQMNISELLEAMA